MPIWRKTHKQKVDDKIESLFESYRMVDKAVANGGKLPQPEETDKYFWGFKFKFMNNHMIEAPLSSTTHKSEDTYSLLM